MKNMPTLADGLMRNLAKPFYRKIDPDNWFRKNLAQARRFVLDEGMSAFMADLAYASLPKFRNDKRDAAILDGMRSLARLPHKIMWLEFDMRARGQRAAEEYGAWITPDKMPQQAGWLMLQHPQIETAFMAIECMSHPVVKDELVYEPEPNWLAFTWRSDNGPSPWRSILGPEAAGLATGIMSYHNEALSFIEAPFLQGAKFRQQLIDLNTPKEVMAQHASELRYIWSLLAAINDVPLGYKQIRPIKGYYSRGIYKKFVEHTVIRLQVPKRIELRTLAKRVMAASRRRAHTVRGHWRRDFFNPGERIWIKEHQRGDASLGFVLHDYQVLHEEEEEPV